MIGGALVVLACVTTIAYGARRIAAEQAAYHGKPASRCFPTTLNRSATLPGTSLSVSPLPDSFDASPRTQISLLGVGAAQLSQVSVSGSVTGKHTGRLIAYSQGDGASFVPSTPFVIGELVTVSGRVMSAAGNSQGFVFRFTISDPDPFPRPKITSPKPPAPLGKAGEYQVFHSLPEMEPPSVQVTADAPETSPGYIFTAPYSGPGQDGPMIFENSGALVWFDPLPANTEATNLQVQQYGGQPVLTWWQGYIPPNGFGEGEEVIANNAYQQIAHIRAGNGYEVDLHDFHINPNNTAVLTVFNPIHCNLTSVEGPRDAAVTDSVFEELDLKTGLVRREWHSLDHVALDESHASPLTATTTWPFDYFHINSIDQNADGTTLISARNTWALYELDTQTGQIITRAGSKSGGVKMGSGTSTAFQHDATELPDGDISVFDNGGVPNVHPQTRGIIVSIDPKTDTDTLIARFEHPTPLHAGSQGDIQPMSNGDFFIGWGAEPYFSEFSSSGQLLFDAHMPAKDESYRSYRFAWSGTPAAPPAIAAAAGSGGRVKVYASWNGATGVSSWRLLAGPSPQQLQTLATVPRSGFETTLETTGPEAYVAVQAIGEAGAPMSTSPTIKA